jgi:hypothetical protein
MLMIRGMPLISHQEWNGTREVPAVALTVLALAFIAGFSRKKMLRICLPPAVALFIFVPSLTFFSDYPRFVRTMLIPVSLADLTLWFLFAMAESCRTRAGFISARF